MKLKYKLAFMDMAERFGQTSEAVRLKVGALLVKENRIISLGINGQPEGWPTEVCEEYIDNGVNNDLVTLPTVRHAEVAALEKLQNSPETARGSIMFVNILPCEACAIKIVSAGITEVYYRNVYRSLDGLHYLKNKGVRVQEI